jgi:phage gp29-like protein
VTQAGRQLFPTATSIAYDRYGRDLSQAIRGMGSWIHDPSFSLGTDDMIYEKVRRDAVTQQAMTFRKHLITGRRVVVEPASDDKGSKLAAAVVEELLDQVGMFSDARFNLSEAVFRGSTYAFIEGEFVEGMSIAGQAPMTWWVPRRLVDVDRRRFRLRPVQDPNNPNEIKVVWFLWSVSRQTWEPLEHPEWFVKHTYQRTEDTLHYGRGLLDSLHFYQASKMRVLQEGLAACERFGQGMIVAKLDSMERPGQTPDGTDNTSYAQEYLRVIDKMRARNTLVHAKEDDLQLLTGFGEGWQLIKELLAHLDNAIRTLILGANLPTSATSGGSFALAEIQENSTEALVQFDRELLSETLTRDLIGLVWSLNAENFRRMGAGMGGVRMPVLRIKQEKREDPQINASVISAALAAGIPLRRDEVYDKLGFTQPQEEDEVIAAPQPDASGLPLGGF